MLSPAVPRRAAGVGGSDRFVGQDPTQPAQALVGATSVNSICSVNKKKRCKG